MYRRKQALSKPLEHPMSVVDWGPETATERLFQQPGFSELSGYQ